MPLKWSYAGCLAIVAFIACVCCSNVAFAGIISTKQEIAIGEDVVKEIEKQYKLVEDPVLQERVAAVGGRLAGMAERQGLPYTFKVLDTEDVNALAVPGGFIYIFKGLTDLMQTDDELAGILAHEVGHIVKRHSMGQLEKNIGMTILMAVAFGDRGVPLQMTALHAISAGYSRSDERQADKIGYELSVKAGYNPYGLLVGLMKLMESNPKYESDLFSGHPDTAARIDLIRQYLAGSQVELEVREVMDGQAVAVFDGAWCLPEFKVAAGGNKPLYRAYLAAGNLHSVFKSEDYSADKYILDSDGAVITIYYDERALFTLTPEDALAAGISLGELAERYVAALKAWSKYT